VLLTFSCWHRPFFFVPCSVAFQLKKPCVSGNIRLDEASPVRISFHLCWNCETPLERMDVEWPKKHVHERSKFNRCLANESMGLSMGFAASGLLEPWSFN